MMDKFVPHLSDYVNIILGGTPATSNPTYWGGNIPWVSVTDFKDSKYLYSSEKKITNRGLSNSNTKLLNINDLIISARGTVGKIVQCKERVAFNQSCYALITKDVEKLDQNYLYYLLKFKVLELKQIASGGVFDTITKRTFELMKIDLPSVANQRKIAAILTAYDDLIENNNKQISILENMAENIYKEWFVRMRFPGYKKTKFVKGIPQDWDVKQLDTITNITSSKRIYANEYVQDGIPFFRSKEIIELHNNRTISTELFISEQKYNSIHHKFGTPLEGDILITSVGTLGITYQVKKTDKFYFKDGNLIWLQKISPIIRAYIYRWLNSESGQGTLAQRAIGSSQPAYTIENIKKVNILIPSKSILNEFNTIIEKVNMQLSLLVESKNKLETTRDLLLPRLLNGKLQVENLDIKFPPSMENEDA